MNRESHLLTTSGLVCQIFPYISVPHVFEAVRVPAVEGETGAREAAQKAEADQSVHGIFYFFVSVVALPTDNC